MHASQLAQIGSWIAIHAPNLIFGGGEPQELVAVDYWVHSKARLQRWVTSLKMFQADFDSPSGAHDPWPAMEVVIEEIFVSEFLTRIWSAAVLAHDSYRESDELFGVAHSVHISHIEARNRAMRILLAQQGTNEVAFERLNRIRQKTERWTDVFLAMVPDEKIARTFAFDANRVSDFQEENQFHPNDGLFRRQQILLASFSAELRKPCSRWAANPDLNRQIASSLMNCFPADRFDSLGLPKAFGMVLLEKSHDDTQALVSTLLELDQIS